MKSYQEINAQTIDAWCEEGWTWGKPITHEEFVKAKNGEFKLLLTPNKPVPKDWFPSFDGLKILGLASGGGQQGAIFTALGADVTILDYSEKQLKTEQFVAKREGYEIKTVRADMTKRLPFDDESFDLVFNPVSLCYVEKTQPIFEECHRILKKGGVLICGLDNGVNFLSVNNEKLIENKFPFNPLENHEQMVALQEENAGIQFSHTIEDNIGGQIKAGFVLTDLYEDTNDEGYLKEMNIPSYVATRAIKYDFRK